jgi:hypothetical protein
MEADGGLPRDSADRLAMREIVKAMARIVADKEEGG